MDSNLEDLARIPTLEDMSKAGGGKRRNKVANGQILDKMIKPLIQVLL